MNECTILEGELNAVSQKHAIIIARFNEFVTESLLKGALNALKRHGADLANQTIIWVPGAYEIPQTVAKLLFSASRYDSIICLGAVIRGSTPHFDYVAGESAKVGQIGAQKGVPVVFGVLTTETIEQAIERAGTKAGNKGFEAATTAIEMVNLFKKL